MNYSVLNADNKTYMDFDNVAFEGACSVIAESDDFYGGKKSKPYVGQIIVNPTWGQLFIEAMKQQQQTLDFHHSFLEGFRVKTKLPNENFGTIYFLDLTLGS